ncbi:hypothetical protein GALMADRAFT_268025 [Galerina marginata CBS 339.88]|uniref:Uncharacterized protein n=1 Tax=Galerina marginata (strain CBS 339.88) TaxID=685588 RepID=A0A067T245_GALM3|nr:hypothetical protein GALMADRAFT_268025 [Galerina marginata CBS 339.88]
MYTMANSSELLHKLGIDLNDLAQPHSLDVYHANVGLWENERLDRVRKVHPHQTLFIRVHGIHNCVRLDELSAGMTTGTRAAVSPSQHGFKRKADDMNDGEPDDPGIDSPPRKRFTRTLSTAEELPNATRSANVPFNSATASSSSIHIDNNPPYSAPPSPLTSTPSSVKSRPWPQGWYASEVGPGMERMDKERSPSSTQEDRFHCVFPGAIWYKPTFQRHKSTWKNSTEHERRCARSLPQDATGLWSDWYVKASGKRRP